MELENIERGPTAALRNGVSGSFTCDREKERDFIEMFLYSAHGKGEMLLPPRQNTLDHHQRGFFAQFGSLAPWSPQQ